MSDSSALLLVGAVAAVGVLHTIVPDHWMPITLLARQRGWSRAETTRVAFKAGMGHVVSTLLIGALVWVVGVAVAQRYGHWVDTLASLALVGFGLWIALSAWRDLRSHSRHGHGHSHEVPHGASGSTVHGPELQRLQTEHGVLDLSIYESGVPPRFRLTGNYGDSAVLETRREGGQSQTFVFANRGDYWESTDEIPEPHQFDVTLTLAHEGHPHTASAQFTEHSHGASGRGQEHEHPAQSGSRTALLLILGSSPMIEGIPAFFAASKYGLGLVILMSLVFGATTIATYVVLCVFSTAGLQRVSFGRWERYGEVLSGGLIALVGVVFWIWPVLEQDLA
jgi:ABC-type nickel/cobalt efflux system permease component RcnA